jgi:hypothetical protein
MQTVCPEFTPMVLKRMLITLFANICRAKEMLIPIQRLRKGCMTSGGAGHCPRAEPLQYYTNQGKALSTHAL